MMRVPDTGGFVAMVTLSCLLLFVGRMDNSASAQITPHQMCKFGVLAGLENKTIYEVEYRNDTDSPRSSHPTIVTILGNYFNSSSRKVIAAKLVLDTGCLDYLDFTLPLYSLFFLETCQFKDITFKDVFQRVFSSKMEGILRRLFQLKLHLRKFDIIGNETLGELALSNDTSLNETTVLDYLLAPLNNTDAEDLAGSLEIDSSWLDLLNHTISELAAIFGVPEDDLKHYSYLTLMKYSFAGNDSFYNLKLKTQEVRASLKSSWRKITAELMNVTTVLDVVFAHVPERLRCLTSFIIGVNREDLQLLNRTLPEFADLLNKTVSEFEGYTLHRLITFIVKTKKTIVIINGETQVEIRKAVHKILVSYNVTIENLIESFNLTKHIIDKLSPFEIEVFCARYTLIRYASNFHLTLTDVAVKLNKTEADLSYNLTVKAFHVVIRRLLIVRTFEVMSQMLGVSRHFLENSLEIPGPVSRLSMCELDAFFNITRHTVLDLSEVVTQKTLAFVVQINGVSITFAYKLTIEQFITQIMHLDVHYFFKFKGLKYSYKPSRLRILLKYHFFELERLFHLNKVDGEIIVHRFSIFRHSLVWIINKIIDLVETDKDECRLRSDRCHRHSHCANLPGSYVCHCPVRGYRGRYCDDINECKEGLAICPRNADCINTPGSYKCECGRGFRHNVTNNTCDDINECASNNDNRCFWGNLQCKNTVGSYYCSCPKGYTYDSRYFICRDINECKNDRDICSGIDKNAKCKNRRPGYECYCEKGFEPHYNNSVAPRVLVNCTDINECASSHSVCPLHSECVNTIGGAECHCFHGYELKGGRCRAKRFIRILSIWVRFITFRRRNSFARVDIPSGILYFGKLHKRLYIYRNGLISIGKRYYRAQPKRLKGLKKDVLAVFWANTDATSSSHISYQVVDRSTPEFREQLDNTSDLLKNCSGLDEFKATWMLVVTWERVSPYARFFRSFFRFFNPYDHEQSTYQAVIITNGTSTYLIYSYEDGGMNWNGRLRRKCAVGYATKDKKYSYEEEDSFTENIFNIDNKQFVNGVGEKKRGVLCMSLNTPDGPTVLTNEQKCMNWYNEEPDPDLWLAELSDCPASRRVARRDNRYKKVSSKDRKGSSKVDCYELKFATRVYGASHQCCYFKKGRRNNAFVSDPPQAGRAYRYHHSNKALRQKSDIEPFEACCAEGESTLCSLFYEKRPLTTAASAPVFSPPCACRFLAGGCRRRSCRPRRRRFRWRRPFWAFGWNDPHITTLDGCRYTFNGLGDYILFRTKDNSLEFHARTKRPRTAEGDLANATVFSGIAVKSNTSGTVQVFFDSASPGNLSITITRLNGSCRNYNITDFDEGVDFNGMLIERSSVNNKTLIISLPSGFSVEASPGIRLLQHSISMPDDLMNKVEGLLGNFNGDKMDDLQYPNGSMISCNASDEDIFKLGQKWVVPYRKRMFVSSSCMLQNVSFDDTFIPAFLNLSAVSDADKAICGDNRECLFDLIQTGDKELAVDGKDFDEENQAIIAESENIPPEIKGPAEINVTLGERVTFYLQVSDGNNDTVTLELDEPPEGAMFNFTKETNVGHFMWTPVNATNATLEFVATDSKNSTTVLPVIINMCKCENNGECDFTEFVGDNTGPFRVVGCNCSDEYEGTFCEIEVADACMDDPCYDNVTCNTTRNPFGFQCGPCPAGLTGDGENCFENDECANASLSRCNQTCVNTFGSFRCECNHGYISREDGRICEEINECKAGANLQHNCTENAFCTNLPGSFNCTCNPGFEGDPTSNCTDIDECNNGVALCSQGCRNTPGSFVCSCKDGFQLAANNETCEDKNECEGNHNCERICDNTIGSYKCQCPPGLELNADNTTCKVAEGSACDVTKGGCSDVCVNRTGLITCYCNAGYNLTNDQKTCTDINECMTGSHGCSHKCLNNDGSFTCSCHPGYVLDADKKTCKDVNECESPGLNNCSQDCENNDGSFQCSCDEGFSLAPDNKSCTDINECSPVSPCSAGVCKNEPGSFQCTCPVGTRYSGGKCRATRVFAFSLTLAILNGKVVEWDVLLLKQDSAVYGLLARRVEKQFDDFYRKKSKFSRKYVGCRVRKFRQGSVVADVDLNFDENATDVTPAALNSELPKSGQIGNLTYDPQKAAILDFNECNDQLTHNCYKYATCVNKPGTFECKCKDGYQGDGTITCDSSPKPADPEDDDKKKRLAIIFGVLGGILAILILIVICFSWQRKRHYKAAFEDANSPQNLTARSVRSDVYFPEKGKDKEENTGYYEITPAPMYENPQPGSPASGDYDYPDPFPAGTRETTFYDNPGLQQESGPVKKSHSDSAL